MYLHCDGTDEWYGPADFEPRSYNGCRVLIGASSFTVARFSSKAEAKSYAATLLEVLMGMGYRRSKAIPEEVYVRNTVFTNWRLGTRIQDQLSDTSTYLIRLDIKK